MRQVPAKIKTLIEPVVTSLGYELVGIEYLSQGRNSLLRVYIDSEEGITVDDCGNVSHQLSGLLDVEDIIRGHYNLEVSSPGLDRPLFTEEHFRRFTGAEVKIKLSELLQGSRKYRGIIRGVTAEQEVCLEVDGVELKIPMDLVEKANLVPEL